MTSKEFIGNSNQIVVRKCNKGLTAYVDSLLYSTYLVVLIRLSYEVIFKISVLDTNPPETNLRTITKLQAHVTLHCID